MSGWPDPGSPGAGPDARKDPGAELVDWVDEDGSVIDVVTRRRMRAEGLRHRCTYVVVAVGDAERFAAVADGSGVAPGSSVTLDADTEIVVHLRADWKDVAPSHWDLAFGGVCGAGEDWEVSARRELAEEAGIELDPRHPLVDLGPTRFDEPATATSPGTAIVGRAYLVSWPDEPVSTDGEAVAFDRVPLSRLAPWMASVPVCADTEQVVAPRLLALLNRS